MTKRSRIDRLFRLWDELNVLRDIDTGDLGHMEFRCNMDARRSIIDALAKEYGIHRGMLAKSHLVVGCCIYLIRK